MVVAHAQAELLGVEELLEPAHNGSLMHLLHGARLVLGDHRLKVPHQHIAVVEESWNGFVHLQRPTVQIHNVSDQTDTQERLDAGLNHHMLGARE